MHIKQYISIALFTAVLITTSFVVPRSLMAATTTQPKFEIAGWIPYWKTTEGGAVAEKNLNTLTTVFPFGYGINADGTLNNLAKLGTSSTFATLKTDAQNKNVKFIPTITWNDGQNINHILSDTALRTKQINDIGAMITTGDYDGVDIDYEGKLAITKDSFSTFLKELKAKLGTKELVCSIEARTPPTSLYHVVPPTLQYANDYKAIGISCDKVVILAYDQGRADFVLNGTKAGSPYMPIADVDWVRKVTTLAMQSIPKEKIILGIPTYGTIYQVTIAPNWFKSYQKISSGSALYATQTATLMNITPGRNKGGELSYSYAGAATPKEVTTQAISATPPADIFAAKALAYANATSKTFTINTIWWSDSTAIKQKVDLAKELGLAGVSLFKIDGTEDPNVWTMLAREK